MTVFYRVYRPQRLADLIGQEFIAKTLLAQLEEGKFGHGYLFYGPKGTGKTSTARILAKAVNCLAYGKDQKGRSRQLKLGEPCNRCTSCLAITNGSHLDLIEIDAASNRGIDEIRDLREKIKLSPVSSRFKVYIIDETHMLTTEAFNALLKTLEEPPAHAIFVLCTTEVGKLPQTIISRLQKFNFVRARKEDLARVIEKIAKAEKVEIEKEAIDEIAEIADGSYRDAVSIFDQLSAKRKTIKFSDVFSVAKIGGWNQLVTFLEYLADKKLKEAVLMVEKMADAGADVSFFAKQVILFAEKLLFLKIGILQAVLVDLSAEQVAKMQKLSEKFESSDLQNLIRLLLVAESEIKLFPLPQIPLVLAVCKFVPEGKVTGEWQPASTADEQATVEEAAKAKEDIVVNTRKAVSSSKLAAKSDHISQDKKSKGSVKRIEENWDKFLAKVKPINAHVVALLKSSRPIDFDGSNVTLEVFYKFHKEKLEEPKIARMLDNILEEVINQDVKLRFVLAQKDRRPPRVVAKSDVIDINESDLKKMAQEIFSK